MGYVSGLSAVLVFFISLSTGQRITTIQLDGVQYFVSRMNPYSPELNYYLAYQYCRSLGLQLVSFETKEKADSITQYLKNAGYDKFDFWTSGNRLGTHMFLWMSTGLPFNATFNYMKKAEGDDENGATISDIVSGSTSPQRTARESDSGSANGCVVLKAPNFEWDTDDCVSIKDFICEQTRCYYYNYGSIPVSTAQGKPKPTVTTTQSTPTTENIKNNFIHISNIINKLRSTQSTKKSDKLDDSAILTDKENLEQSTNGPYDNFNSHDELQDDPAAIADQASDYVSTIQPEKLTTIDPSNPSMN
ncbi:uncharacterized protein LOC123006351 isoform X2 [Tribolium madens]|uniref:uncharacterized protein LOC123006351 isoform X2 n=2 Tax=Tribolium madens TaxID=41895 RepID=UPI001CF727FB|nr:uncharacterized protein LOC123006351 isoform X2 [Tribolium madens]